MAAACPNCGRLLPPNGTMCLVCGADAGSAPAASPQSPQARQRYVSSGGRDSAARVHGLPALFFLIRWAPRVLAGYAFVMGFIGVRHYLDYSTEHESRFNNRYRDATKRIRLAEAKELGYDLGSAIFIDSGSPEDIIVEVHDPVLGAAWVWEDIQKLPENGRHFALSWYLDNCPEGENRAEAQAGLGTSPVKLWAVMFVVAFILIIGAEVWLASLKRKYT